MSDLTRIYYNKLVRDNTKDKIEKKGKHCDIRILSDVQEYQQELLKKVREEAYALSMARSRDDFLEGYADLMIVIETMMVQLDATAEELREVRDKNIKSKGTFKKRHFLHWSDDVDYNSEESPQGIPL